MTTPLCVLNFSFVNFAGSKRVVNPSRSPRAKRLSLRVDAQHRFILTIPNKVSYAQALQWAESKTQWIQAQAAQLPELLSVSQWLERHPFLSCLGRRWSVLTLNSAGSKSTAKYHEASGRIDLCIAQSKQGKAREQSLYRLLRELAQQSLKQRVDYWARHR